VAQFLALMSIMSYLKTSFFVDTLEMCLDHKKVVSLSFPWGDNLEVRFINGDFKDLAAQSAKWEYRISRNGKEINNGTITAIGGLCGSFSDCYYPQLRGIERELTIEQTIQTTAFMPEGKKDDWSHYWSVLMTSDFKQIIAVAQEMYSDEWVIIPPVQSPENWTNKQLVTDKYFQSLIGLMEIEKKK